MQDTNKSRVLGGDGVTYTPHIFHKRMRDLNSDTSEERIREIGHAVTDLWILLEDQRGLTRAIEASVYRIQEELFSL